MAGLNTLPECNRSFLRSSAWLYESRTTRDMASLCANRPRTRVQRSHRSLLPMDTELSRRKFNGFRHPSDLRRSPLEWPTERRGLSAFPVGKTRLGRGG